MALQARRNQKSPKNVPPKRSHQWPCSPTIAACARKKSPPHSKAICVAAELREPHSTPCSDKRCGRIFHRSITWATSSALRPCRHVSSHRYHSRQSTSSVSCTHQSHNNTRGAFFVGDEVIAGDHPAQLRSVDGNSADVLSIETESSCVLSPISFAPVNFLCQL